MHANRRMVGGRAGAAVRGTIVALLAVFALGAAGCVDDGPIVIRDQVAPAKPQAVKTVTGDERVTLSWVRNTESDLAGYRVYRGTTSYDGPFLPLGTTGSTTYVDDSVVNGTTYYYAVAAYDDAGNESDLSTENTVDTPRPAGTNLVLNARSFEPALPSGYDFSADLLRQSGHTETDIYYELVSGTRLMVARDLSTDIQDAGFHALDDLDWAPGDEGWSPTGSAELILGHAYYVWTRTGNFAKFRVTSLTDSQVRVDWAYQLQADNPELMRTPRRGELSLR